ncbi:MAG TPA: succinate dehydrogenase cytochrome b subunit [Lentimicrobium sp.]|nr:succinate dehydrogenase cytochrome b subunit [Lentimicrobium sp.]
MAISYSSITKKVIMALAGLFLIAFLFVHLTVNLLVLINDGGETFNKAAHFMVSNPVIQFMQIFLFGGFILHIIMGVVLQIQNWRARPQRYKVEAFSEMSPFSKFMIHTGIIVFAVLLYHLYNFFFQAKTGNIGEVVYNGQIYEDMGKLVVAKFSHLTHVIIYIFWMLFLGFHLDHAFHSGLQSLGFNHNKYTPAMFILSRIIAIILTVGFIIIPLVIYLTF